TRSDEFADRFAREAAMRVDIDNPTDADRECVDVRELVEALTVEELAQAADDQYKSGNPEYWLAKPLTNVDETPEFLIRFAQLLDALRPLPGMRVLDFGAGTCWTTRYLTQLGYEVVALDVSPPALALGRHLFER